MTTSTPAAKVTRASLDEHVSVASGVANALIGPSSESTSTLSNAAALGAAELNWPVASSLARSFTTTGDAATGGTNMGVDDLVQACPMGGTAPCTACAL